MKSLQLRLDEGQFLTTDLNSLAEFRIHKHVWKYFKNIFGWRIKSLIYFILTTQVLDETGYFDDLVRVFVWAAEREKNQFN